MNTLTTAIDLLPNFEAAKKIVRDNCAYNAIQDTLRSLTAEHLKSTDLLDLMGGHVAEYPSPGAYRQTVPDFEKIWAQFCARYREEALAYMMFWIDQNVRELNHAEMWRARAVEAAIDSGHQVEKRETRTPPTCLNSLNWSPVMGFRQNPYWVLVTVLEWGDGRDPKALDSITIVPKGIVMHYGGGYWPFPSATKSWEANFRKIIKPHFPGATLEQYKEYCKRHGRFTPTDRMDKILNA